MVSSEEVAASIGWLSEAFGFREVGERFTDETGRVTQAELDLDGARVMIGWPGPEYRSPAHHAATCEDAARWLEVPWVVDGVLVSVADVDTHHAHAVDAGAKILREPGTTPAGRLYTAEDPDGHRWMFLEDPAGR